MNDDIPKVTGEGTYGCVHYPPLYCKKDGMTAQYEHTIYLDEGKKIIFSNSTDY